MDAKSLSDTFYHPRKPKHTSVCLKLFCCYLELPQYYVNKGFVCFYALQGMMSSWMIIQLILILQNFKNLFFPFWLLLWESGIHHIGLVECFGYYHSSWLWSWLGWMRPLIGMDPWPMLDLTDLQLPLLVSPHLPKALLRPRKISDSSRRPKYGGCSFTSL